MPYRPFTADQRHKHRGPDGRFGSKPNPGYRPSEVFDYDAAIVRLYKTLQEVYGKS
jgi:hypothetical protein